MHLSAHMMRISEFTTEIWKKIDLYSQRQKRRPETLLCALCDRRSNRAIYMKQCRVISD